MTLVRINKYLAELGYASRREADNLVARGLVKINGVITKEMGIKIDPSKDKVELINRPNLNQKHAPVYLVFNKPCGYISSTSSNQGACVTELIPKKFGRLYPVGRLDKLSEGLMILTNDGELTNIITHPKYEHEKEYEVVTSKILTTESLKKLVAGFYDETDFLQMKKILPIRNNYPIYKIILEEGKKRQIRRMLKVVGVGVVRLKRTRINKLKLGDLPVGKWRLVRKSEII